MKNLILIAITMTNLIPVLCCASESKSAFVIGSTNSKSSTLVLAQSWSSPLSSMSSSSISLSQPAISSSYSMSVGSTSNFSCEERPVTASRRRYQRSAAPSIPFDFDVISCSSIGMSPVIDKPVSITQIFNSLSLEEKIGQLIIAAAVSDEVSNKPFVSTQPYHLEHEYVRNLIEHYKVGGIIFLGTSAIEQQIAITNDFQQRSHIPLLIAQDLEWGLSQRIKDAMVFPHAMTLGALHNPDLIYQMYTEVARQASLLGVHLILAPVVDVNNNAANPVINDRSFGSNPQSVAHNGISCMHGFTDAGILSCAKHFPGHGDTATDSHYGLPIINHGIARLHGVELYPFKQLIDAGIPMIMVAHMQVPALEPGNMPTTVSSAVITDLLKNELGFNGLIISDGLGMKGATDHYAPGELELKALLAGTDILLCPVEVPLVIATIKQAVEDGIFPLEELDARVLKILRAKAWAFNQHPDSLHPHYHRAQFHPLEAQALKKELYGKAITIVRDGQQLINRITTQSTGVLTIGIANENTFGATLAPITDYGPFALSQNPTEQEIEQAVAVLADTNVIIVGMFGMNKFIKQSFGISDSSRRCIDRLHATGKNIILVLFGSPYAVSLFDSVASIMVAYEPDPDAQHAAADVIRGLLPAQGRLPV